MSKGDALRRKSGRVGEREERGACLDASVYIRQNELNLKTSSSAIFEKSKHLA